jgi:hypothetical protein
MRCVFTANGEIQALLASAEEGEVRLDDDPTGRT